MFLNFSITRVQFVNLYNDKYTKVFEIDTIAYNSDTLKYCSKFKEKDVACVELKDIQDPRVMSQVNLLPPHNIINLGPTVQLFSAR